MKNKTEVRKLCAQCEGTGKGPEFLDLKECPLCHGNGEYRPKAEYAFQLLHEVRDKLYSDYDKSASSMGQEARRRVDDIDWALACLEEYLDYTPEPGT